MITLAQVLDSLAPDAEYVIQGDTVLWLDDKIPQPTEDEIEDEKIRLEFEDTRFRKLEEIAEAFDNTVGEFTKTYPEVEKLSWYKQEVEARAYLADGTESKFLQAIADKREVTIDDLAQKIVEKADAYTVALGEAIGYRQKLEDIVNAATTLEEIVNVTWDLSET